MLVNDLPKVFIYRVRQSQRLRACMYVLCDPAPLTGRPVLPTE